MIDLDDIEAAITNADRREQMAHQLNHRDQVVTWNTQKILLETLQQMAITINEISQNVIRLERRLKGEI